ncbi:uncharacterized protein LOC131955587 isoform X2 [Physella acuta]|uniref:uncharacterized protein LOC131955587 isoform X2 n=1 Tax=Physella acuta TaxID=109671 RepID=UPI0027DBED07|nr:uncharacterized protein LOC131955587 isoform X2 [Physella acuta]
MESAVVKPLTRRRGNIKSDNPVAKNANVNQMENVGNCEPHVNFKVDTLADPVSNLCKPVTCPSFRTFRKNAENKANENVETTPATAVGEDEATKPEVNLEEKDVCCDARTPSPEYDVLEVVETNPRMLEKSVPSPTHSSAENHNGMCKSPHTNEQLTSFQPSNPHCEIDSFVPNVTTDQIDSFVPGVITDQPDQIDSFVPNVIVEQIDSFFPDVITEKSDHKDSPVPHVITDQVDSFIPDATPDQSELIPDTVQTFVQPVVSEVSCNDQEVEDFLSNSRHLGGPQLPDRDSVLSQHGDNQMPDPSPPPRAEYGLQLIKPDERDSLSENKEDLQLDRGETQSNSVYVLQGRCELNPPNPYTATVVCSINSAQPIGDCNLPNIGDTQELNLSNIGDTQELNLSNIGDTQELNLSNIGDTQELNPSNIGDTQELNLSNIGDTQELNLSNIGDTQELNLSNINDTQGYNAPSISDSQDKLDQLDIMEMEAVKNGNEEDLETNGQYGGQSEEDTMQVLDSCDIGESCLPSEHGEVCTLDQSQAVYEATHGAGDFAVNVHTAKDVCDHEENQHITQEETCPSFEEIDEKRLSIDELDEKRLYPDDSSSGCVSADNNDDLCDSGADEDKRVDTKEGEAAPRLSSSHNHAGDNNTPHQSHRLGPGEADEMFRYSRRCSEAGLVDAPTDQVDSFIPTDQSELILDMLRMFVQPVVSEVSCNDLEVEDFLTNSCHQGGFRLTSGIASSSKSTTFKVTGLLYNLHLTLYFSIILVFITCIYMTPVMVEARTLEYCTIIVGVFAVPIIGVANTYLHYEQNRQLKEIKRLIIVNHLLQGYRPTIETEDKEHLSVPRSSESFLADLLEY